VPETIVLLHGFSGTSRAWDGVVEHLDLERYRPLALDLPGHGAEATHQPPITFHGCVERLLAQIPGRFALCGYSLGGRVALHIALAAPERITRLTLVSANPGIEDASERAARRRADRHLADELERVPFEDFIERWRTQPLFAADPPVVGELARADQRRNSPWALAEVLRGLGVGEMASLWSRLEELTMPVTVIVGDRDEKFLTIGRRLAEEVPDGSLRILEGGHGLPLENPKVVAAALEGDRLDAQPGRVG
jgi:2-succinyl-6-hydroxy-2,4-cyclohexadiene-1-carboxylate synthase